MYKSILVSIYDIHESLENFRYKAGSRACRGSIHRCRSEWFANESLVAMGNSWGEILAHSCKRNVQQMFREPGVIGGMIKA